MKKTLVAMAAGMGSRFGGLKQAAKFGKNGKVILDFALEDAMAAGMDKLVFVIRKDIEKLFRDDVSKKYESLIDVDYVFQDLSSKLPLGRSKPWGTGHAVLCCANLINGPLLAINADDYYGPGVYLQSASFMDKHGDGEYALAGYKLSNTLSENGGVSRGVCKASENMHLENIREFSNLKFDAKKGLVTSAEGEEFSGEEFVSLNFWTFSKDFMNLLGQYFDDFMALNHSSQKAEFYLPSAVDTAIRQGCATAEILPTNEKWQGVTYKEDLPIVEKFLSDCGRA